MTSQVADAILKWREKLLDLSKRNRLIHCPTGKTGAVAIEYPDIRQIWRAIVVSNETLEFPWKADLLNSEGSNGELSLFAGDELSDGAVAAGGNAPASTNSDVDELEACKLSKELDDNDVLTSLSDKALSGKLYRLALNAQTSLSEQGVNTLYLAFGMLRWYEAQSSDVVLQSPLLLVPARLHRPSLDSSWQLSLAEEEVLPNYCLTQSLLQDFSIALPAADDDLLESVTQLDRYLDSIRTAIKDHQRWSVAETVSLGVFTFQKVAMWADLGDNQGKVAQHPMCRALAGEALDSKDESRGVPTAQTLDDTVSPRDTFHILDCDSSQHEAIEAVKQGLNLVLDGPPGTGKSQTIANMIAEFLAMGRTVLFVSEKAAALEVVKRRLDSAHLGDFCLECHSHKAHKKDIVAELGRCLALGPEQHGSSDHALEELLQLRQRLNGYVRALHRPRGAMELTPYQIYGRLAAMQAKSECRCRIPDPLTVDVSRMQEIREAIGTLLFCRQVVEMDGRHPWRGCKRATVSLTVEDDIRYHFGQLIKVLPKYLLASFDLQDIGLVGNMPTMCDLCACCEVAKAAMHCPPIDARWFQHDARSTAQHYLGLEQLVEEYNALRTRLPEYKQDVLTTEWNTLLNSQHLSSQFPFCYLVGTGHLKVRESLSLLEYLSTSLFQLAGMVRVVEQLSEEVIGLLQIRIADSPTMRAIPRLLRVAELVAESGRVPVSWFDPIRRRELKAIAQQRQTEARTLAEEHAQLAAEFTVTAFAPASQQVCREACASHSLLRRLLPGWRRCRKQLESLYVTRTRRPTKLLVADAKRLLAHDQSIKNLHEFGMSLASELRASPQGVVEWDTVLKDIGMVEDLEGMVQTHPKLRELLSEGSIDKAALSDAIAALKGQHLLLVSAMSAIQDNFDLRAAYANRGTSEEYGLRQYASWLDGIRQAVQERHTVMSGFTRLLLDGRDVEVSARGHQSEILATMQKKKKSIDLLYAQVGHLEDGGDSPELRDWSDRARLAQSLLHLMDKYQGTLAPPIIAIVSDPQVRSRVAESVRRIGEFDEPLSQNWQFVESVFDLSQEVSTGIIINTTPLESIVPWLSDRIADVGRIREWLAFQGATARMEALGLAHHLKEILTHTVSLDDATDAFLVRFYRVWLDAVYADDPDLRTFIADDHERTIARFRQIDRAQIGQSFKRIRARCLRDRLHSGQNALDAPMSSELGVLQREVQKKRRHLPLRQLFKRIPTLLQDIKPCLMMSPLAVSTFLDSDDIRFDLVVFDEASQIRPHDAVCAIYRSAQLVVAGDQKQLPPTTFFERQTDWTEEEEDEEDISSMSDFESILDVCSTLRLPRKRLRWHYRSRRESLIAFSNRNFYSDELVTFPSIHDMDGKGGVTLAFVQGGYWQSGSSGGFNVLEGQRTVDLVFEQLSSRPHQSVGVITMNQHQQLLVLEEIERRRQEHPELEGLFSTDREESVFVKNLENVQGDERDVIFLSVGYAPDRDGNFAMRFGPLNMEGGERRLNVAVTRARHSLTVVSSIRVSDINLSRTKSTGVRLLREYLDYAERGIQSLAGALKDDGNQECDSPFEEAVAEALVRRGFQVRRQVGCSGFRIDLALVDPKQPGRYVLGIECDGATYHRCATARDRDRLRQEVLEDLGWRICRIWSTDWFQNPEGQIAKVVAAYTEALASPSRSPEARSPRQDSNPEEFKVQQVPKSRDNRTLPHYRYSRIEDVPREHIVELILAISRQLGATGQDELAIQVARHLGFARTGSRISRRIKHCIRDLLKNEFLCKDSQGRMKVNRPAIQ